MRERAGQAKRISDCLFEERLHGTSILKDTKMLRGPVSPRASKKTIIFECETLAAVTATLLWRHKVSARQVVHFCDNEGAKHALISGTEHEFGCQHPCLGHVRLGMLHSDASLVFSRSISLQSRRSAVERRVQGSLGLRCHPLARGGSRCHTARWPREWSCFWGM